MSTPALSWRLRSSLVSRYAIAILSVAAAVAANLLLAHLSWAGPSLPLFLCAVMLVAQIGGAGPALLATALAVLTFDYFFLEPVHSFALEFKDMSQLAVFAVTALFVVWLVAAQRSTTDSLRQLNETLQIENSELRRAEKRAGLAEKALLATIDTIPALAARYRPDGSMDFVNQTWRTYTGLSQASLGEHRWGAAIHPEDLPSVEREWGAHLARGEPFEMEQRLRRADGDHRWHWVRRVPLRDENGDVIAWYGAGYDIEDRKRAEAALHKSEARLAEARRELQLTIDSIPAFVAAYEPDGTRSFVNQTWQNYTGVTLEDATGERGKTSFQIHPDDAERADIAWRAALASGKPLLMEVRLRGADGAYRWYALRRAPLRDGKGDIVRWYSVGFDIEEQKRVESALQRSEAYLAEAQKLSLTGSFAWGDVNDDHFWSDQTYEIVGVDPSVSPSVELVRQRVHPDDRPIFEHEVERAIRGAQKHDYELRLIMPDGRIKHLHIVSHRRKYESGKEEIVGALMDITEARKSQQTLHAAQSALSHASRVATLGEISATIAHEVNQPLAAIVTNGQACLRILRSGTPDLDDVRGAVNWIVKDGNRAGEVIRRVRGLMKKADTQKVPLDVNDTINEVAALLRGELAAHHVSLRRELASAMPLAIADRIQLQQVIINLVMNGIEAMREIASRPRALVIRSHQDEAEQVVVAVKDSGIGVPADTTDRLFEAFFSTKPSGLGMGLSICRSIIEDHGGRLWATANDGEPGATFRFVLPSLRESAA